MDVNNVYSQCSIKFDGLWGDWGPLETCNGNGYAIDFSLKVDNTPKGPGDCAALNGICLHCSGGDDICSTVGQWGTWHPIGGGTCETGMKDFQLRFEQYQGGGGPLTAANDNTAANNLALRCKDGGWRSQAFDGYGDWSQAISCPSGSVICGLRTRVEKSLGGGANDDTSLNGVEFWCC